MDAGHRVRCLARRPENLRPRVPAGVGGLQSGGGASAIAQPGTVLYFLPRADFDALFAANPKAWEALATRTRLRRFLQAGSTTDLDTACVAKVRQPPFFLNFNGSAP